MNFSLRRYLSAQRSSNYIHTSLKAQLLRYLLKSCAFPMI